MPPTEFSGTFGMFPVTHAESEGAAAHERRNMVRERVADEARGSLRATDREESPHSETRSRPMKGRIRATRTTGEDPPGGRLTGGGAPGEQVPIRQVPIRQVLGRQVPGRQPSGRPTLLLWLLLTAFAVTGCDGILGPGGGSGAPPAITELPRALSPTEIQTITASNAFGLELLRQVLDETPDESVFLSPFSASMALGMTMNGADGETFEAMRSTLQFGELTDDEINAAYRGLLDLLTGLDPDVELAIGNSVWFREDLTVRQSFRDRVESNFDARIQGLDFSAPGAADVINGWASDATMGRIDEMIEPPIPGTIVAYLMNAVYFNAGWTRTFDPADTEPGEFERPDGTTGPVEFMTRRDTVPLHGNHLWTAVDLPYAGQAWAMTVVVPHRTLSLHEIIGELTLEDWNEIVGNLNVAEVRIALPRFELEWEAVLNDQLKRMGMEIAFDGRADFTRMFEDSSPWIDEVKQKTFVRVDEEGTEAAAVTSVSLEESGPTTLRADRPFLFAIRERLSGTILFMGAIVEPPTM
ncbi:MAG: serpin family protein [Gemmatimonadales bacterium]|nr:MAG: serpin family protein [Gemmatimonadales bacterium]